VIVFLLLATMLKPNQSDMVLAYLADWIDFLIPGIKKWGIGSPYK
jgi:hypothetical protein